MNVRITLFNFVINFVKFPAKRLLKLNLELPKLKLLNSSFANMMYSEKLPKLELMPKRKGR